MSSTNSPVLSSIISPRNMGLQIPSFPLLFSFLFFIFMVLKIFKKTKKSNPPPGPWKYPLIGNIPQLKGGLPHHRLTDLARKYGPVMSFQLGELDTVVISSAEAAREVLKTQDSIFADRNPALAAKMTVYDLKNHILFAPYGDHWRQMRKLCTLELLSAKRVQLLRPIREREVAKFMNYLHSQAQTGSPVNLSKTLSTVTNSIITFLAAGSQYKEQQRVLGIINEMLEAGVGLTDAFPSLKFVDYITGKQTKVKQFFEEVDRRLEEAIKENKALRSSPDYQGEHCFIDVLLSIQESNSFDVPITNDNIKAIIMETLGAGTESSAKITEWSMVEMMRRPETFKKAQDEVRRVFGDKGEVDESKFNELKFMRLVIKEAMRLHPAGPFIPRECRESTKVLGYNIKEKTTTIVNIYAIQRDPNVWKDPEKFLPERFEDGLIDYKGANPELLPFGAGKRVCPGIALGVAGVELIVANLLYHFDWKLPEGAATPDVTESFGSVIKRKNDLILVPVPAFPKKNIMSQ